MTTKELFLLGERSDREVVSRSVESLLLASPEALYISHLEKLLRECSRVRQEIQAVLIK